MIQALIRVLGGSDDWDVVTSFPSTLTRNFRAFRVTVGTGIVTITKEDGNNKASGTLATGTLENIRGKQIVSTSGVTEVVVYY